MSGAKIEELEKSLLRLKVVDLKLILKNFGLPRSGNKSSLMQRLVEYADRFNQVDEIQEAAKNPHDNGGSNNLNYNSAFLRQALHSLDSSNTNPQSLAMDQEIAVGKLRKVAESDPFARLESVVHEMSLLNSSTMPTDIYVNTAQIPRETLLRPNTQLLVYCVQIAKGRKQIDEEKKAAKNGRPVKVEDFTVRWPPAVTVNVNNSPVKVLQQAPDGRLRIKAVRERPADITQFVTSSHNPSVNLQIMAPYCDQHDEGARFAVSVVLSKKLTTDVLMGAIPDCPRERTQELVRMVFGDGEIEMSPIYLGLKDQVTLMMIEEPVRGLSCNHVQCFDARSYLNFQSSVRNANFRCPVCDKHPVLPNQLVKDPWFAEILQEIEKSGNDVEKVELFEDMTWRPYVEGKTPHITNSSSSSSSSSAPIDKDSGHSLSIDSNSNDASDENLADKQDLEGSIALDRSTELMEDPLTQLLHGKSSLKRPPSPMFSDRRPEPPRSPPPLPSKQSDDVIDLLDSDDED
mmetsp:Transcript_17794/g.35159  ORF Transcript_17794/g.35159 Transcript_17794/m.35159 type:complete len:516 (+) Transcript_17794:919-2466(+)